MKKFVQLAIRDNSATRIAFCFVDVYNIIGVKMANFLVIR
jgi:hypothetical protein